MGDVTTLKQDGHILLKPRSMLGYGSTNGLPKKGNVKHLNILPFFLDATSRL